MITFPRRLYSPYRVFVAIGIQIRLPQMSSGFQVIYQPVTAVGSPERAEIALNEHLH